MAVAHSILQIAYYLLARQEPYRELGGDFDKLRPANTTKRLVTRLEKLGYKATLEMAAAAWRPEQSLVAHRQTTAIFGEVS